MHQSKKAASLERDAAISAIKKLRVDHSKLSSRITRRTGREEELISVSVGGGTSAEFDGPQPWDADEVPARILHGADKLSCRCAETIDPAVENVCYQ